MVKTMDSIDVILCVLAGALLGCLFCYWWIHQLNKTVQAKQARIDALMLEFCPNEMTVDQLMEWASHQQPDPGCMHCNHILYAGTQCPVCGKVTRHG